MMSRGLKLAEFLVADQRTATHLELDLSDLLHDGGVRLLDGLAHGVLGDAALLVEARFITACRGEKGITL